MTNCISTTRPNVQCGKGAGVSRITPPPKDAHSLVPETSHNVTFNGNRDLVTVIKLRILSREDDLDCVAGRDAITKVIMTGGQEWQDERRWEDEAEVTEKDEN